MERGRKSPGEPVGRRTLVTGLVLLLLLLSLAAELAGRVGDPRQLLLRAAERGYAGLWRGLDRAASEALTRLEPLVPAAADSPLGAFESLGDLTGGAYGEHRSYQLLDPAGDAVAWSGEGLLHEIAGDELPAEGRVFRASYSAVSLLRVVPLGPGDEPWRLVVGRSFSSDQLPFSVPGRPEARSRRWTLALSGSELPADVLTVELAETPTLVIEESGRPMRRRQEERPSVGRRLLWLALGLLALVRAGLGLRPARDRRWHRGDSSSASAAAIWAGLGAVALVGAASAPWLLAPGLALSTGVVAWGWGRKRSSRLGAVGGAVAGVATVALMIVIGWGLHSRVDFEEPASLLSIDLRSMAGLLIPSLVAFGILLALRRRGGGEASRWGERAVWAAGLALLIGCWAPDRPWLALPALAAAGALVGVWIRAGDARSRLVEGALLLLFALVGSVAAWEVVSRVRLRTDLEERVVPGYEPPSAAELTELEGEVRAYFAGLDLADLTSLEPSGLDRQDLAFEIWHHSPLAREAVLSALVVQPESGPPSTFAVGVPLDEDGRVEWSPARWEEMRLPVWQDAVVSGSTQITSAGRPWAVVEYWLLFRPGFRLSRELREDLASGLLRRAPAGRANGRRRAGNHLYALYSRSGGALTSPWRDAPPLEGSSPWQGARRLRTPDGRALAWSRESADGVRVVYLLTAGPVAALERAAGRVAALGAAIAILLLPLAAFHLSPRGIAGALSLALRSYSKRLLIVLSALVLIPLVGLDLFLLRILEQRIETEQRVAGESALESAQQVLGDYVLSLEPGFGLDVALDDELLIWLADVVHHEVNLYWRSSVYASSKPELFTAGLLPKRIPGEVYSRLTLLDHRLASRVNRIGGSEYLELYAPLRVPGVPQDQARLFLSMPLLAQEEEAAAEVLSLRRRALLGTLLLVLLLVALGVRSTRSFTRPLLEIVQGTQRIAAGETDLDLNPSEQELAMLSRAIQEMSNRIAEGRKRLLREKRVVERMVENINSAVVSLDRSGRVVLGNRLAFELLGVEVGEVLADALARRDHLEPLARFLREGKPGARQQTVTIGDGGDEAREWTVVLVPLPGGGDPAQLLVVEDVTEVLRGQRLEAWAEMARIIAHEIKNPLTPIRLSAEHMREVYRSSPDRFEQVLESCTANILSQVRELQQISGEFSTYSRIPRIEPVRGDLSAAVEKVVEGYRAASPRGVSIDFSSVPSRVEAEFDTRLLGRAVRNLIENALRATEAGGRIEVMVDCADDCARIRVSDDGPGIDPSLLSRIFDPYFSTHDSGTGLGLPIARRIAEQHGGRIAAHIRPRGGLEVTITLGTCAAS